MTSKVSRADKIFERIQARTGMSEAGKNWLICVLDPMHDEKLMCEGYPDRETQPSVVQVIKQSIPVSKPASYGANDIWGFHVKMDSSLYNGFADSDNATGRIYSYKNEIIEDATASFPTRQMGYGGLNVVYFDQTVNGTTDVTTSPTTEAGTSNKLTQLQISPANFGVGKTRVLSQGFEVVNTTSQLYKGGALMVYEQPSSRDDPYAVFLGIVQLNPGLKIFVQDGPLLKVSPVSSRDKNENFLVVDEGQEINMVRYSDYLVAHPRFESMQLFVEYGKGSWRLIEQSDLTLPNLIYSSAATLVRDVMPPISLAESLILPGSQQWDAEEGAYMVQTMNNMENPPSFCTPRGIMFVKNELTYPLPGYEATPTTSPAGSFYITRLVLGGLALAQLNNVLLMENQVIPFNTKGAIITGQQPSATFTINYNTVVERIISSQDQTLATLAKPSPPEDYVAIELYSMICQTIPIGCKFKDNDLGDWILGMADQVANVVSSIGKPIMAGVEMYQNSRKTGSEPVGASFVQPIVKTTRMKPLPPIPQKKKVAPQPPPKPQAQQGKKVKKLPTPPKKKGT